MKITVLNGSPKGDQSVTMQYVHFIQKKYPQHELKILNVAQKIKKLEKNEQAFQEIMDEVRTSEGVLWAFPLYVMLVHAHYKRFIELIWERNAQDVFKDRYVAVLTTSIHWFDHTAHNYMHGICDDLEMKYIDSYSAAMYDLTKEPEQKKLMSFAENVFETIEKRLPTFKQYNPVTYQSFEYVPDNKAQKIEIGDKKVLIITDAESEETNEWKMVQRLKNSFSKDIEVINLNTLDMKGSCLGCIQCGYDNTCAWEGKDDFCEFYKTKVIAADVLIFAGTIKDRYLSSRWKTFFDRHFFYRTHTPSLTGKQLGFLIFGPLSQVPNLRVVLEAYTEWQQLHLVDIVTDESEDSVEIDVRLQSLAERLIRFADQKYIKPATFLGVGGMKVFRDEIYGRLRVAFQADHKFYKKLGFYDFPQKDYKMRIIAGFMTLLLKIPAFRKRFYTREMKPGMIRPLQKVVVQV